jgi:general secretion pathway protein E
VQSALTGHLVYTTVHANSVFDVLGRFRHMGIDAYNLVSALNAVLAQRLVRLNCRACAVEERPDRALLAESRIPPGEQEAFLFLRGRGCVECRGTGYKGRKAVGELLVMTDELSELVIAKKPVRVLRDAAIAAGTIPLRKAALELARRGESTLEEVNRVTLVA